MGIHSQFEDLAQSLGDILIQPDYLICAVGTRIYEKEGVFECQLIASMFSLVLNVLILVLLLMY